MANLNIIDKLLHNGVAVSGFLTELTITTNQTTAKWDNGLMIIAGSYPKSGLSSGYETVTFSTPFKDTAYACIENPVNERAKTVWAKEENPVKKESSYFQFNVNTNLSEYTYYDYICIGLWK